MFNKNLIILRLILQDVQDSKMIFKSLSQHPSLIEFSPVQPTTNNYMQKCARSNPVLDNQTINERILAHHQIICL